MDSPPTSETISLGRLPVTACFPSVVCVRLRLSARQPNAPAWRLLGAATSARTFFVTASRSTVSTKACQSTYSRSSWATPQSSRRWYICVWCQPTCAFFFRVWSSEGHLQMGKNDGAHAVSLSWCSTNLPQIIVIHLVPRAPLWLVPQPENY